LTGIETIETNLKKEVGDQFEVKQKYKKKAIPRLIEQPVPQRLLSPGKEAELCGLQRLATPGNGWGTGKMQSRDQWMGGNGIGSTSLPAPNNHHPHTPEKDQK